MYDLDSSDLGRKIVAAGLLRGLRDRLQLNRSSMAELLHTSVVTYTSWEERPGITLWPSTATKVGRFYRLATKQLELLHEDGIEVDKLIPLHHATTLLGIPQELLLRRYREGVFDAEDLGILGLWLYREDLERIRELVC